MAEAKRKAVIRKFLWLYAGLNFAALIVGTLFWYGDFLATAQVPLWAYPFIPDCPLANGIFGLALVQMLRGRRSDLLNQWAAVSCIKYGTWTMTFWGLYWSRTGDYNPLSLVMFAAHAGLTVQGIVMLHFLGTLSWRNTLLIFGWFILSDAVDYAPIAPRDGGYGWYPPLPLGTELVPAMLAQAVAMTWLLSGALVVRLLRHGESTPTQTRTAISGFGGRRSIP